MFEGKTWCRGVPLVSILHQWAGQSAGSESTSGGDICSTGSGSVHAWAGVHKYTHT